MKLPKAVQIEQERRKKILRDYKKFLATDSGHSYLREFAENEYPYECMHIQIRVALLKALDKLFFHS